MALNNYDEPIPEEELKKLLCRYCELRERKEGSEFCGDGCEYAQKLLNARGIKDKYVEAAGRRD